MNSKGMNTFTDKAGTSAMVSPSPLKRGDKVAVICLSSGVIGEAYCEHEKELGIRRLRRFELEPVFTEHALMGKDYILAHPEARAADLKAAFLDDSVKGIITSIGGIETFRTFPYLMEDETFRSAVRQHPKFFLGFSDTTNNHLMFHRLGLQSFREICSPTQRLSSRAALPHITAGR